MKAQWHYERAARLEKICLRIKTALGKGQRKGRLFLKFSRSWNGRPYRSAPAQKWRLSAVLLSALYKKWLREGASAFDLHFAGPRGLRVSRAFLEEVFCRCANPKMFSVAAVFREIEKDLFAGQDIPGLARANGASIPLLELPHTRTAYRIACGLKLKDRRKLHRRVSELQKEIHKFDAAIAGRAQDFKQEGVPV